MEGDGVAEGFELADVAAFAAFGVDAGGVEVGAEVAEASRPNAARTSARFSGVMRASASTSLRRNLARACARSSSVAVLTTAGSSRCSSMTLRLPERPTATLTALLTRPSANARTTGTRRHEKDDPIGTDQDSEG